MEKGQKKYSRHEMADQFIKLANDLSNEESVERVGAAIMFAAARFNAFDIAQKSDNLQQDKADALQWFTNEYHRMLDANIDEYIEMLKNSNYK